MSKTSDGDNKSIEVDKRIRDRRMWRGVGSEDREQQLKELPDLVEQIEYIDIEQPAIGPKEGSEEQEAPPGNEEGSVDQAAQTATDVAMGKPS